jgi:hypothetical protein
MSLTETVKSLLLPIAQDPVHHPEGDAWTHTRLVIEASQDLLLHYLYPVGWDRDEVYLGILGICALVHDIGKRECTIFNIDKEKITSYKHDTCGAVWIMEMADTFQCLGAAAPVYAAVTEYHMRHYHIKYGGGALSDKSAKKIVKGILSFGLTLGEAVVVNQLLYDLAWADMNGRLDVNPEEVDMAGAKTLYTMVQHHITNHEDWEEPEEATPVTRPAQYEKSESKKQAEGLL